MSETQTTDDPILDHLYARKGALVEKLRETNTRLSEIDELIEVIRDGRSRVNRQRKARTAGNSTAPPPEPDGNSTADGMALLNTSRLPLAERVVAAMQRDADSVP